MLISIVIPLYNKGPYIERALRSVLAQTYGDWELIIIDDGSTDDGPELAKPFLSDRVRLIHQENAGVSIARNRGADLASGDYVVFLDADDEWLPAYLERISGLIALNPEAGMFICRHQTVRAGGIVEMHQIALADDHLGEVDDFLALMRRNPWIMQTSCCSFNKQAFLEVGGFPEGVRLGEDTFVFLQVARRRKVMFDARYSSRYYRDVEHSLVSTTVGVIPYYIRYFLTEGNMPPDEPHLLGYVMRQAFMYAAVSTRERNLDNVRFLARHTWPLHKPTSLKCYILLFMPHWLFRLVLSVRIATKKRMTSRLEQEVMADIGPS